MAVNRYNVRSLYENEMLKLTLEWPITKCVQINMICGKLKYSNADYVQIETEQCSKEI